LVLAEACSVVWTLATTVLLWGELLVAVIKTFFGNGSLVLSDGSGDEGSENNGVLHFDW
jgi:hypothetical protein